MFLTHLPAVAALFTDVGDSIVRDINTLLAAVGRRFRRREEYVGRHRLEAAA